MGETDLISRKDAIDANCIDWCNRKFSECPYYEDVGTDEKICDGCDTVLTLKDLPSARPERNKGKWIDQDDGAFYPVECSECRKIPLFDVDGDYVLSNFCPNCGAMMLRGEQDA